MSNKAHLRPHKKQRQASRTTRVLVVILFVMLFVLSIALAASGHGAQLTNLRLLRAGLSPADCRPGVTATRNFSQWSCDVPWRAEGSDYAGEEFFRER